MKSHFVVAEAGCSRPTRRSPLAVSAIRVVGLPVSLVALTLVAGCANTGPTVAPVHPLESFSAPPGSDSSRGTSSSGTGAAQDNNATYVIGPGDTLYVYVFEAPQLSLDVPVRPDGRISTPLIPEMVAAGKTPSQLAKDLTERLRQFVKEPNVTVIVRGFVGPLSRQIRVIGEAAEPQAVPYRDHMTVLDVMIMTKGLTRYAAGNRAVIVRRIGDKQETIHVHLSDLLKDGDINENVELQPGDTLIIPQAWF